MSADLRIHYLGGYLRSGADDCAALAKMRERGQIVKGPGRGITLRLRSATPGSLALSSEGGHLVAALTRNRHTTPWVAILHQRDAERMQPWLEGARAGSWLRRLMSGADALVVPSDSAACAWKEWVPEAQDRIFRVYPYLGPCLDRVAGKAEPRVEARSPIRVSLSGHARSRPELGVFRSVLDSFLQRCPELRSSIEVSTAGSWSNADLAWAQRSGISLLSKKKDRGDLVIVVDGGASSWGLPAGLFSALRSGRPVLSISRSQEAQRLVEEMGLGLHVDCGVHGWADRGACVIQRALFRRALKRGLVPEYAPRPAKIAEFSPQNYSDAIESICRSVLSGTALGRTALGGTKLRATSLGATSLGGTTPKPLGTVPVNPQVG